MKALEPKKNDKNIGSTRRYEKMSKAQLGNFQLNFSIQVVNHAKKKIWTNLEKRAKPI